MRRIIASLLLLAGAVDADDMDTGDGVNLDVRPLLCIIDRRTPACEMDFLVAWQSASAGRYCLYSHFAVTAIRCWEESRGGEHEERRRVDRSFQFWLTDDEDAEPLAAVTVEVMTTDTNDRRRQRRTRHVWDIL